MAKELAPIQIRNLPDRLGKQTQQETPVGRAQPGSLKSSSSFALRCFLETPSHYSATNGHLLTKKRLGAPSTRPSDSDRGSHPPARVSPNRLISALIYRTSSPRVSSCQPGARPTGRPVVTPPYSKYSSK